MTSRASNIPAIEKATGIEWSQWVQHLAACGAQQLSHERIAQEAARHMPEQLPNPGWWAQSVAVAYEQHIGRRLPGQAGDGTFQFSVSRTVNADLDTALAGWEQLTAGREEFNEVALDGPARTSGSEKWRYWRASLADGSKVSVDIGRKGPKSTVAVSHSKLRDPGQVDRWKGYWRTLLRELPY